MLKGIEQATVIGDITDDLTPEPHPGGGVAYMSKALEKLGIPKINILTMTPPDHAYLGKLRSNITSVISLDLQETQITSFINEYDTDGHRTQILIDRAGQITQKLLLTQPPSLFKDALVIVTPVIGEVDINTYPYFKEHAKLLVVLPQGYFRQVDTLPSKVRHVRWNDFEEYLKYADVAILSNEDITIDGSVDTELLERITTCSPITILTQGAHGATIYKRGKEPITIQALALHDDETQDFTGAGEVFAAAFLTKYSEHGNLHRAGTFACLYASIKIMGIDGIGLESIPSLSQLKQFLATHPDRIATFAQLNNISVTDV